MNKTIQFTVAYKKLKKNKCLEINLTNMLKDLSAESYNALLKEIKEDIHVHEFKDNI